MPTEVEYLKQDLRAAFSKKEWETVLYVLGRLKANNVALPQSMQDQILGSFLDHVLTNRLDAKKEQLLRFGLLLNDFFRVFETLSNVTYSKALETVSSILVNLQMEQHVSDRILSLETFRAQERLLKLYTDLDRQLEAKKIQDTTASLLEFTYEKVVSFASFFREAKKPDSKTPAATSPDLGYF